MKSGAADPATRPSGTDAQEVLLHQAAEAYMACLPVPEADLARIQELRPRVQPRASGRRDLRAVAWQAPAVAAATAAGLWALHALPGVTTQTVLHPPLTSAAPAAPQRNDHSASATATFGSDLLVTGPAGTAHSTEIVSFQGQLYRLEHPVPGRTPHGAPLGLGALLEAAPGSPDRAALSSSSARTPTATQKVPRKQNGFEAAAPITPTGPSKVEPVPLATVSVYPVPGSKTAATGAQSQILVDIPESPRKAGRGRLSHGAVWLAQRLRAGRAQPRIAPSPKSSRP